MKHQNIAIFVPHLGCPNQCSFCNQRHISGQQCPVTGEEAARICQEALHQGAGEQAEIAFFGGSFTAIPRQQMLELLTAVQPYIGEGKFSGIRISTRPDGIDEEILQLLQQYRVKAIELGVQSMDDDILQKNHRGHTATHVKEAVALIRKYPFQLGLQFMPGLDGDTEESMRATALAVAELRPDTVRIYPTIVLEGTELAQRYQAGLYRPLELEQAVRLCADFLLLFEEQGIRVIRTGLHASETVENQRIAGPYHPAFRELCESRILYTKALELLKELDKTKAYHLFCAPQRLSALIGQGGCQRERLLEQGYNIKIKPLPELKGRELSVQEVQRKGSGSRCS